MTSISSLKQIKKGLVLIFNNEPYIVIDASFLRMQQAKPVMQTKMKSIISGKTIEYNFKYGDKIEITDLDKKKATFLYKSGDKFTFMDTQYEQIELDKDNLGDSINFLKEGIEVYLLYWNNNVVSVSLPPKVDLEVIETEPGVRGNTAQGSVTKPAKLETGYTVQVPIFIKTGDIIRVNTETGEYVSRV